MKFKVNEVEVKGGNMYLSESYEESGLFMAKDESGISSFLFVNKYNNMVSYICMKNEIPDLKAIGEKVVNEKKTVEVVSEDLFLKSLSLFVNKDESYKK